MASCRLALRCSVLLCLCLTLLAPTQGRSLSGDLITEAGAPRGRPIPTQLTQNGAGSKDEVGIVNRIPAVVSAARSLLDSAPAASPVAPPTMTPSTETAPATTAPSATPAQENMCTYDPVCRWDYDDEKGVAHKVCNTPPPEPRGWNNMCPEDIHALEGWGIMVASAFAILCVCGCLAQCNKPAAKESNSSAQTEAVRPRPSDQTNDNKTFDCPD